MSANLRLKVSDNLETPLRLNSIRLEGAVNTRASFLARVCEPYIAAASPIDGSLTLAQLLKTTRGLTDHLNKLGIFKSITPTIADSENPLSPAKGDVDLLMSVVEAPRVMASTQTNVGDGEGTATALLRIRNTFGSAETLEANASFGTRTKSAYAVTLDAPLDPRQPDVHYEASAYALDRDMSSWASCREATKGAHLRVKVRRAFCFPKPYEAEWHVRTGSQQIWLSRNHICSDSAAFTLYGVARFHVVRYSAILMISFD